MSMKLPLHLGALKSLTLTRDTTLAEFSCVKSKGLFSYLTTLAVGGLIVREFLEGLGDFPTLFPNLRFVEWDEDYVEPGLEGEEGLYVLGGSIEIIEELAALGAIFPSVQKLSIPVRRSKGDRYEVPLYKAIGTEFPNIERLSLTLDAGLQVFDGDNEVYHSVVFIEPRKKQKEQSKVQSTEGAILRHGFNLLELLPTMRTMNQHRWEWSEDSVLLKQGDPGFTFNQNILDVMVNSAIDGKLARQFFDIVAASSPKLQRMIVRTRGCNLSVRTVRKVKEQRHFSDDSWPYREDPVGREDDEMASLMHALQKQWVVDRCLGGGGRSGDGPGVVKVKEIRGEMSTRQRILQEYLENEPLKVEEKGGLPLHFRYLWPRVDEGSKWWWKDWQSWA
ncbi:hypothetical protein QC764_607445 [Podospora pseudoanserina]|uniref:Uncharacterized protein n=1 Tax=Podospora pseudoanserina TaxID=2609844 RepID=A0ABR0HU54_9PEZI|nr:hypothetical protein QC764_607445 [Podospora pseudoanserina]